MVMAPDGRILIAEKNGKVRIFRNDSLVTIPMLSIAVDDFNERGLEGIVLDPSFEQNGYLYVYYTVPNNAHFNRLSRFQINGDLAIPGSETVLFEMDPLAAGIHNGGAMQFGNDGKLYVATGDGAYGAYAGDLVKTHGKVLRLNPDGTIPEDNPFYTQTTGKYRAIYARGLRNPFTMTKDPVTGRLFVNDVGREDWEEVNEILPGAHYGWQNIEGKRTSQPMPVAYQDPFYTYSHVMGCAVVGGSFYQPAQGQFPQEYVGKYFFGDYCNGSIRVLNPDNGQFVKVFATGINRLLLLLTGPDGSLYYIARGGLGDGSDQDNTGSNEGSLWKINYTGSGAPHVSVQPQPVLVPLGETTRFVIQASGAAPLQNQWEVNGLEVAGATHPAFDFPAVGIEDDGSLVRCRVWNDLGADTSQAAILSVTTNRRPVPRISLPLEFSTYAGGDTLHFEGSATDPESGPLPDSALTWKIDFYHEAHAHPGLMPVSGISSGTFVVPRVGELSEKVWYLVSLTATDPEGLKQTAYLDIKPRISTFRVETNPTGIPVNIDGLNVITPWEGTGVEGMERTIEPVATVEQPEGRLIFRNWENAGRETLRTYVLPGGVSKVEAWYSPLLYANGTGLTGSYYSNNWNNPLPDTGPVFRRIDSQISFDWGESSPDPIQISGNEFMVVWEGSILPYESEEVTFYTLADDGCQLYLDDQLVIDDWAPHRPTEREGKIHLEGGQKHSIRLVYFEYIGGAQIALSWSGERFSRELIPQSQLFPGVSDSSASLVMRPIYPSPADDFISVWFVAPAAQTLTWQLLGPSGRVVDRQRLQVTEGESLHFFDLRGYASGIYQVVVQDAQGKIYFQKIRKN